MVLRRGTEKHPKIIKVTIFIKNKSEPNKYTKKENENFKVFWNDFWFLDAKPCRIIRKSSQKVISRPKTYQIAEEVQIHMQELNKSQWKSTGNQKELQLFRDDKNGKKSGSVSKARFPDSRDRA